MISLLLMYCLVFGFAWCHLPCFHPHCLFSCPPSLVHDNFPDIVWRRGTHSTLPASFVYCLVREESLLCKLFGCSTLSPPAFWESRTSYHRLIGVFWLRPGNDWLDVILVSRVGAELRRFLRCGSRLDPMDDHCRAVFPGSTSCCHVHRCAHQLDGQLSCWHWLPNDEGTLRHFIWIVWFSFILFLPFVINTN